MAIEMKEVYLLRHGDIGKSNYYIGSTNLSLTSRGVMEVEALAQSIKGLFFDEVYCSPLKRCQETSSLLSLPGSPIIDDNLREIDFGAWEGKRFCDLQGPHKDLVNQWVRDPDNFTFPQGESLKSFHDRIESFHHTLQNSNSEKVLVVTHGGVIRHLLCRLLRLPLANYLLFSVETGSFSVVEFYANGGILKGFNLR